MDVSIVKNFVCPLVETWVIIDEFCIGNDDEYEALERNAVIDWSKFNLAKQAFQTCETDGEEGLTWDEVDACEVRACNIPIFFLLVIKNEYLIDLIQRGK